MIIGFSTGCVHSNYGRTSINAIKAIRSSGCNAIELATGTFNDLRKLKSIDKKLLRGFSYISLHAPAFAYRNNKLSLRVLDTINDLHNKFKLDTIVFHPTKINDFSIFEKYNLPVAFENMDFRRNNFKTVKDMKNLIKKTGRNIVLDAQHAFSLNLAFQDVKDFSKLFKGRIQQVHLSGLNMKDRLHTTLHEKDQSEIIKAIPRDIPVIIESDMPKFIGRNKNSELTFALKKELNYINKFLR